ncbi:MAG TPA: Gfo/Idh/MocA family oxidoreductase [Planctomycetota bacterium]|nr:Gfo/Idh/MocA family oxidoreductase [Planctomycetota bacterium]HRR79796.1 Gfo/Idh/MocA family oxidoreductase [Planctomycetota bacterium]HRT94169.1 Gfo/Idh/MocA family oxidoreductase [Planctomycetota bacterium]
MAETTERASRREFLGAAVAAGALAAATASGAEPKSDRKIRMGIVGGGFGSGFQWHLDPNCQVVAVSDLQPGRRAHLQRTYRCETAYESLEKLVLDAKVEAVAVFTGAPDHARHAIECMKHGKHVISAVPACLTLDEAAALKETKERTGLKYMMAETSYYRAPCIFARELYAAGKFGRFLYSEVEYYHHNVQRVGGAKATWQGKEIANWRWGLPPMFYPTHSTGFHIGVTRERFTAVSCLGWGTPDDPMLKDNPYNNPFNNQVALFRCSGGNICRCNVLWWIHADGERAQWLGETLSLYMPHSGGQAFAVRTADKSVPTAMPDYNQRLPAAMVGDGGHGGSHPFLTHEFITALVEEREPAVDIYESLAMTVPGLVAMESSRKGGEQLKIASFDKG